MYYKKKNKKGKKSKNKLGGEYRYSRNCKKYSGLTSSEMEELCNRVSIKKRRYKVKMIVY